MKFKTAGFTLIELLVVIIILSALVTMTLVAINPIRQISKAKDAQRQQDLVQLRNSLDTYLNDANCYPSTLTFGAQFANGGTVYMQKTPQDPDYANGRASYAYETESAGVCPQRQWNVLFAKLSNSQNLQVSCSLLQMKDSNGNVCVPTNYQSLGYNYCVLSGKVNCDYIAAHPLQGVSLPSSTPTPTSMPTSTSSPTPGPSDPWSVPFLGRTPSGQIHLTNCSNVTISGKQFVNIADDAIIIENCNNVTITGNDFSGDVGAIYALNSTNVTVTWNRFQNIGNGTIGSGHSNYIQFNNTWDGYIGNNKGIGGNTEDMISIYKSGGSSVSSPLIIENNAFESPLPPNPNAWSSGSGSGSMLGDSGGSHIIIRNNTYLSPGQVGIGIPSGTDIHIIGNTIYGAQRVSSNVGIYVWNQATTPCNAIEVSNNQVKWYRADGAENPYWNAGNCGTVSGESTNNWHAPINPNSLHVVL